jgi:hypothetical protein
LNASFAILDVFDTLNFRTCLYLDFLNPLQSLFPVAVAFRLLPIESGTRAIIGLVHELPELIRRDEMIILFIFSFPMTKIIIQLTIHFLDQIFLQMALTNFIG